MNAEQRSLLLGGALTGAVNGLFGGGGGMVAVPLLACVAKYPADRAHATAIAAVLPVCLVSGLIYVLGGFVPLAVLLPVSLGALAGGYAGAKLLPLFPPRAIEGLFALLMFAAALGMLL